MTRITVPAFSTIAMGFAIASTPFAVHAASLVNEGAKDQVLVVTQDGKREEVVVPAGKKVDFCQDGCFVSFSSGEMMALKGLENIIIDKNEERIISE